MPVCLPTPPTLPPITHIYHSFPWLPTFPSFFGGILSLSHPLEHTHTLVSSLSLSFPGLEHNSWKDTLFLQKAALSHDTQTFNRVGRHSSHFYTIASFHFIYNHYWNLWIQQFHFYRSLWSWCSQCLKFPSVWYQTSCFLLLCIPPSSQMASMFWRKTNTLP